MNDTKFRILLGLVFFILFSTGAFAQCTSTDATTCRCKDSSQTDCDLLPDIGIAQPPFYQSGPFGMIEYSQTGNADTANNGKLRVTLAMSNVGHGSFEIWTTDTFICGTDTFYGAPPSICPDNITYPKILTKQRIYHKSGNIMSYWERDAGSMTYHPSHNHMHVDNWNVFSLRTNNGDTNPLNWPIIGNNSKISFCLSDYSDCANINYPDYCRDSVGKILSLASDFPNYGLAGNSIPYYCSNTVQGISSGFIDVYWAYFADQFIVIPSGICNGNYYIVTQVDPNNYFLEENKNNNTYVAPITLTLQTNCPAQVSANNSVNSFNIYPNPVTNQFTVDGLQFSGGATLEMYNVLGEKVYNLEMEIGNRKQATIIDVSTFSKGIYPLRVITEKRLYTEKIVVE